MYGVAGPDACIWDRVKDYFPNMGPLNILFCKHGELLIFIHMGELRVLKNLPALLSVTLSPVTTCTTPQTSTHKMTCLPSFLRTDTLRNR